MCIYIYIYTYIHMYTIYIYIYRQRERERDTYCIDVAITLTVQRLRTRRFEPFFARACLPGVRRGELQSNHRGGLLLSLLLLLLLLLTHIYTWINYNIIYYDIMWLPGVRPISLLSLSILTLLESNFPGKSLGNPYGPGNSTPLNRDCARVQPSNIHDVSREIGRIIIIT